MSESTAPVVPIEPVPTIVLSPDTEVRVAAIAADQFIATVHERRGPQSGMVVSYSPIGSGAAAAAAVANLAERLERMAAVRAAWAARLRAR